MRLICHGDHFGLRASKSTLICRKQFVAPSNIVCRPSSLMIMFNMHIRGEEDEKGRLGDGKTFEEWKKVRLRLANGHIAYSNQMRAKIPCKVSTLAFSKCLQHRLLSSLWFEQFFSRLPNERRNWDCVGGRKAQKHYENIELYENRSLLLRQWLCNSDLHPE